MKTSPKGHLAIVGHEGICLEWYYDSVGVPTIGIGQTKYDGFDPTTAGKLTLEQVFDLYKQRILPYEQAVNNLGRKFTQEQFDALVSFCFNVGPGWLRTLCKPSRTIAQIGDALMLYKKPPEIIGRRREEQRLYKDGVYSNPTGQGLVFPVSPRRHPIYSQGYRIDARPYFLPETEAPVQPVVPNEPPAPKTTAKPKHEETAGVYDWFWDLFK